MDKFRMYREKYEAREQVVLNLFNEAIEIFEEKQYDLSYARKFVVNIDNLDEETKLHVIRFIGDNKYWRLIKPFPMLFKKYLLEYYEQSCDFTYNFEEDFYNRLVELGDISIEILETIFNKYDDSGVLSQLITTRGKTAEKLGRIGSKGVDFLARKFYVGNENDKYCSLLGLRSALTVSSPSEFETIVKLIRDNLTSEYSSIRKLCFGILKNKKNSNFR